MVGTVLSDPAINGCVFLEWDADADGGPYEDEYEADMLTLVDPIDAHYVDLARAVDAITGGTFEADIKATLWGGVVAEMVEEYLADNDDEEADDELADTLREGRIEVLIDDMTCDLHGHGFYLDRDDAGRHVLRRGPSF